MAAEDLPPPNNNAIPASTADDDEDEDLFGNNNDAETPAPSPNADDSNIAPNAIATEDLDDPANNSRSTLQMLKNNPPPESFPPGWFLKPSHSSPGNYFYFNQDTGECRWEYPVDGGDTNSGQQATSASASSVADNGMAAVSQESLNATAAAAAAAVKSILKRSNNSASASDAIYESSATGKVDNTGTPHHTSSPRKRPKTSSSDKDRKEKDHHHRERSTKDKRDRHHDRNEPKEVRVLHILKKHRGSRRPASWRNPKIMDSKEKAISDLRELISILSESSGDHKELRATFEELAKTESDCSSAKRGGDLGFFGRKKMQPAFEKASFGLRVGQLSDIVDTSSGVHVILRLA